MKFLAIPESIEEQCVKRLSQGNDKGVVKQMLAPDNTWGIANIVVCQDSRGQALSYENNLQKHFETLYEHWGYDVRVNLRKFSFVADDVSAMMDI